MNKKKAILIMDMPDSCSECPAFCWFGCPLVEDENWMTQNTEKSCTERMSYCPLKPVPEKEYIWDEVDVFGWFDRGWNACLDEILGGTD